MGLFDSIASIFDPSSGGGDGLVSNIFSSAFDYSGGQLSTGISPTPFPISYVPDYNFGAQSPPPPMAQPTMSGAVPMVTGASRALQLILFTVGRQLGMRGVPSLQKVMRMIRQMSRYMTPAAVAAALGIGVDQLATIITANSRRKRRRMNPANVRALRRSVRRLGSFQNLSNRVMSQLGSMKAVRHARRGRCFKCKRSPCSC